MTEPEATYSIVTYDEDLPDAYVPLIISTWLKTLRNGNDLFKLIDSGSYFTSYGKYLNRILSQRDVRLAVLTDDPDVVLGFCVYIGSQLEYWYVKKDFRMLGIGRKLLPPNIKVVTHVTKTWLQIWPKEKYKEIIFNPFL